MNPYLEALRETPEFQSIMEMMKANKPVVPAYNPGSDNTEEWKARSSELRGYNLCLTYLGETDNE